MLSTLLAVVTIDRLGRRIGLYWGAVGQGISLFLAGAFSRLLKENPAKKAQYGGAAALFVYMYTFIFGATWLTIPWVYPTETFPLECRAKGNAFGVFGWSIGMSRSGRRGTSEQLTRMNADGDCGLPPRRQRLADAPESGDVCEHRREHAAHLRCGQFPRHTIGLGVLPRDSEPDPRRDRLSVHEQEPVRVG